MELNNFGSGLQELTFEQASDINGGESLWYWVAYGVGAVAHGVVDAVSAIHDFGAPAYGPGFPPR